MTWGSPGRASKVRRKELPERSSEPDRPTYVGKGNNRPQRSVRKADPRQPDKESAGHPPRVTTTQPPNNKHNHNKKQKNKTTKPTKPNNQNKKNTNKQTTKKDQPTQQEAVSAAAEPAEAVDRLIGLAYAAGAPDNVACVVDDFG